MLDVSDQTLITLAVLITVGFWIGILVGSKR